MNRFLNSIVCVRCLPAQWPRAGGSWVRSPHVLWPTAPGPAPSAHTTALRSSPSWFSPKPPARGGLPSRALLTTASICPSDFHGTRLSTKTKTEGPYSSQEEASCATTGLARWALWACLSATGGPRPQPRQLLPAVRVAQLQTILTMETRCVYHT